MIIRLNPAPPFPTVLFTLSFTAHLPSALPVPQAYTNQLHLLANHELESPSSFHALDKATWLMACIREVIFDISSSTSESGVQEVVSVRCIFVDGDVKEWTFRDATCVKQLQGVSRDVEWSTVQLEKEKYEKLGLQPPRAGEQAASSPPPPPPKKHKKQRSLLMALVASIVSVTSSSSSSATSSPSRAPAPVPTTPPPLPSLLPSPPLGLSSHALRRRARSALVNNFRQHVLSVISPVPSGCNIALGAGYVTWIAQSMLRRTEDRLEALIRQAGFTRPSNGLSSSPEFFMHGRGISGSSSPCGRKASGFVMDSPFFEDDEEGEGGEDTSLESRSTDTDGSSVHTPTDSYSHNPLPPSPTLPPSSPYPSSPRKGRKIRQGVPRTPTPPSPTPSPATQNMYSTLSTLSNRLSHLLQSLHHTRLSTEAEEKQMLDILEVKSRRRAWSNKMLLGGARMSDVGFGMPERGSSLARCVICAEDFAHLEKNEREMEVLERRMGVLDIDFDAGLRMSRSSPRREERRRDVTRLFPVSEEDESESCEQEFDHARFVFPGLGMDGDLGLKVEGDEYGCECGEEGELDSSSPSVRLVEDAENGLLMPLPLTLPLQPYRRQQTSLPSPTPVRARTTSMISHRTVHDLDLPQSPTDPFYPSSLLQEKFPPPPPFDPQTKIEIFDVSFGDEDDLTLSQLPHALPIHHHRLPSLSLGQGDEEFTLAMDVSPPTSPTHRAVPLSLPLPVTAPTAYSNPKPVFTRAALNLNVDMGMKVGRRMFERDEWIVGVGEVDVGMGMQCR